MWLVIPSSCKRFCARETGDAEGVDTSFGSAGDHDVGAGMGADEIEGVTNRVSARSAGGGCRVVRAPEGVAHGDVASREVDEEAGDEEGGDFFRSLRAAISISFSPS